MKAEGVPLSRIWASRACSVIGLLLLLATVAVLIVLPGGDSLLWHPLTYATVLAAFAWGSFSAAELLKP